MKDPSKLSISYIDRQACGFTVPCDDRPYIDLQKWYSFTRTAAADTTYLDDFQQLDSNYDFLLHYVVATQTPASGTPADLLLRFRYPPDNRVSANVRNDNLIATGLTSYNPALYMPRGQQIGIEIENDDPAIDIDVAIYFGGVLRLYLMPGAVDRMQLRRAS